MTTFKVTRASKGRILLIAMPMVLFPFLALLFWAAGGGKGNDREEKGSYGSGLNTGLPDARLKNDQGIDKFSFYQQAAQDSLRKKEEGRRDREWEPPPFDSSGTASDAGGLSYNPLPPSQSGSGNMSENEALVYRKLANLDQVLAQSRQSVPAKETRAGFYPGNEAAIANTGKLDAMARSMGNEDKDPELDQLNSMLDKIAAIQHPGNGFVFQPGDTASDGHSYKVHDKRKILISMLPGQTAKDKAVPKSASAKSAFYIDDVSVADTGESEKLTTFPALIPRTQVVTEEATVQMQLQQDIEVNGTTIPKGNYISGVADIGGERLMIRIKSIRAGSNVYPISLDVYDLDGLPGIHVPGSATADVARQSSDRLASGMGLATMDPSVAVQAASAGVEVARSFIGKKTKLIKMTLPAGYQILLKDSHTN